MYTSTIDINNPNITIIVDIKSGITIGKIIKVDGKYIAIPEKCSYKRSQPLDRIECAKGYISATFYKRSSTGLKTALNVKQLNLLLC